MTSTSTRRTAVFRCVLVLTSLLATTHAAVAERIVWRKNLRAAVNDAKQQKKPMLVKISASWCGYCRKMQKTTFADQTIVKQVNGCFIPVSLDADADSRIVDAIGVKGLPTTVVISPELKVVRKITGYKTAAQLDKHLKSICKTSEKKPSSKPDVVTVSADQQASLESPYAFDQYCLVSLVADSKLIRGAPEHTIEHRGKRLAFASDENRRRFVSTPERFWPVMDGNCPVSIEEQKELLKGDLRQAISYRGQVYFVADREKQVRFLADPKRYAR